MKKKIDMNVQMQMDSVEEMTVKRNSIAIISDGSAEAVLPSLEKKASIFKSIAGINAHPICLRAGSDDELISAVKSIEPTFAGVCLEDFTAPRCFYIESRLKKVISIPVFHGDQQGTAIAILAGLINAFKITMRDYTIVKVAINSACAAGITAAKLLHEYGVRDITVCDGQGAIYNGRIENMDMEKQWIALNTNPDGKRGNIKEIIRDCDVFIGLSAENMITGDDIRNMAPEPIIFAVSSGPEILRNLPGWGGARIVATSRSDYPNHIDSALVFPGFFLGLLIAGCAKITDEMRMAAADALAGTIRISDLREDAILPDPADRRVVKSVALGVALAAAKLGAVEEKINVLDISRMVDERLLKL